MTVPELLEHLAGRGVTLFLDSGRLRFRGQAPDSYTPDLRQLVDQHRAALVDHLQVGPAPVQGERQAGNNEKVLAALAQLADAIAGEPWVTPAHRTILERWQAVARGAAAAGRDPGEFLEGLECWAERWRRESKALADVPPGN